ncbi:arylsulfatase [Fulvitalea axinellae]|uniref:Arylsulfatase n=1 Tax=Fulvitalea axinellae TaxID=1182444 RepID=A0AAU9D4U0_9BACT|nr:arylsulfatase [Fulvitalea axinellae]
MRKTYRNLLGLALATLTASSCQPAKSTSDTSPSEKPNIIFIYADDLGVGDISALNPLSQKVITPAMDRMVKEGLYFADAHSSAAVCTPSRYSLLTGRYNWRTSKKRGVLGGYSFPMLEKGRKTVASLLHDNGYETAMIGKWHLGAKWGVKDEYETEIQARNMKVGDRFGKNEVDFSKPVSGGPEEHGFGYAYWHVGSLDMAPYCFIENKYVADQEFEHFEGQEGMFARPGIKSKSFEFKEIIPDLSRRAVSYIEEKSGNKKPFFLYLPLTAPHTPYVPTDNMRGKSQAGIYGDFVLNVDELVQNVLAKLKEKGIDDNTMVILSSDNGAQKHRGKNKPNIIELKGHYTNAGLYGEKRDIYEGGHRIPFIVRWPGKIKKSRVYPHMIGQLDLMATCAEMLQVKLPKDMGEDSFSFWPAITNENFDKPVREYLVNHSARGQFALRHGDWKYIDGQGSGGWTQNNTPDQQLYNLKKDLYEQEELSAQHPEKIQEMKSKLEQIKTQGYSRTI